MIFSFCKKFHRKKFPKKYFSAEKKKLKNIFEKKIEKLKMLRFWCFAYKKLTSQNFQLFNFFFEKYFQLFFSAEKYFFENFFRSNFLQNENIIQPHSSVMPAGIVHRVVAAIYCSRNREKSSKIKGFPIFTSFSQQLLTIRSTTVVIRVVFPLSLGSPRPRKNIF